MQPNFNHLFSNFPDHSRIWIYSANRSFDSTESTYIKEELANFISDWAAHGKGLQAGAELVFDRILIICVNEESVAASGCSIDSSVRFVKALGQELKVDFFDRLHLNLIVGGQIERIHLSDLTKHPEDLLIDPMVANLHQLKSSGILPVKESALFAQLA